jgi:caffeoyl-CoA O-methyltransferase
VLLVLKNHLSNGPMAFGLENQKETDTQMGVMVNNAHDYFGQWVPPRSNLLSAMEAEAEVEGIPIVGPVLGQWLYLLAKLKNARQIIELGTATGYSAIFLGSACSSTKGHLTTFEIDPQMARRAEANIEKADLKDFIDVQCTKALKGLEDVAYQADMIFMDIEKLDYEPALAVCKQKLRKNGLLVADNTGFRDAHGFNRSIFDDADWESINLWALLPGHSPEHDGVCLALKR